MGLTLDQIINRLSSSELERLKKCAEYGMYDELFQLLRAYGYDESDRSKGKATCSIRSKDSEDYHGRQLSPLQRERCCESEDRRRRQVCHLPQLQWNREGQIEWISQLGLRPMFLDGSKILRICTFLDWSFLTTHFPNETNEG